jgi:tetratricopeptide (TPR) repeat protein
MRLGAERLKAELDRAFGEISRIITDHGGTVEKYIGDAIYALFGAPVAHEDDPLRALRAADAIRRYCREGQQHGHAFSVRIGVETGEAIIDLSAAATTRQQMSVGAVVNIAARLQQRAEPGEVLVGPTTRAAAAAAEFEDLGEAVLKGVGTLRVARLVRVGEARAQALPFVGRSAELALLGHALERARKGRSVLAVVSGPPGQGKTRLVQEFLRSASGTRIIATRCRPADEVGVFAPVREILGVATLDELAEHVGRMCSDDAECERVVAGLAESAGIAASRTLGALGAAEREDEIVQAWRRYLGLMGADALVILAVDDIHWADASLVRLMDRLTFGGPRVLVVATARPEFADAAGIRPSGDRFFIELEGLDPDDAHRLAALAGRGDDKVVERAEGNPLFLVELARAGQGSTELPVTLQGALGARLDHLGPEDRALLSFAAVAGERFTAADAAFLAGLDVADAGRTLARLVDLHFVDLTDRGYRFHHGLIREVAYGRLLAAERMRAHARFAQERVNPDYPSALAHHWWEALRPPDAEWVWSNDARLTEMRRAAFAAHLAAGARHGQHFALDRAIELLQRAAGFAADDVERAAVERALGAAYHRLLLTDEAWAHLLRALELFRAAGEVPVELYAELMLTAQFIGAFRVQPTDEEIARVADEGAAAARARGDHASLSKILRALSGHTINKYPGEAARAVALADAAMDAAEKSGDDATLRATLITRGNLLRALGRIDESEAVFAQLEDRMDGADLLERFTFARSRSSTAFAAGDLTRAEALADSAVALAEPMGPHNKTHGWDDQCDVWSARGDWPKVIEIAHRTARLVQEEKATTFCRSAAGIIAEGAIAHALAGRRDEAQSLLRALPKTDIVDIDLVSGLPRALLGFASPETDARLRATKHGYWEWAEAAMRAVVLRKPDDAEDALRRMGPVVDGSPIYRALAEGVREAVAEMRGGPPARYDALRELGLGGWIEILKRRVDAEY